MNSKYNLVDITDVMDFCIDFNSISTELYRYYHCSTSIKHCWETQVRKNLSQPFRFNLILMGLDTQ